MESTETFGEAYRRLNDIKRQLSVSFTKFKGIGGWYPISSLDQPERGANYQIESDRLVITRFNGCILRFDLQ